MQTRINDPCVPLPRDLLSFECPGLTKLELFSLVTLHSIAQNESRLVNPTALSQSAIALAKIHIRNLNVESAKAEDLDPGTVSEEWQDTAIIYHCAVRKAAEVLAQLDPEASQEEWHDALCRKGYDLYSVLNPEQLKQMKTATEIKGNG